MVEAKKELWTIDELRERVADALAVDYSGVSNGRVRDVPDLRTIRYYTTLGLLDRPAEMRGRTAYYGQRHLNQLVAIKRLQAEGHSLAEIQSQVVGLSNTALTRIARGGRGLAFWKDEPTEVGLSEPATAATDEPAREPHTIELGRHVTLSLAAQRPLDKEDLRILRVAAAPLLEFLKLRGLIPNEPGDKR